MMKRLYLFTDALARRICMDRPTQEISQSPESPSPDSLELSLTRHCTSIMRAKVSLR